MKKISKTVAMVLVLVMLASSFTFTSCIMGLVGIVTNTDTTDAMETEANIYKIIAVVGLLILVIAVMLTGEAQPLDDAQIYLASTENTISTEYFSLMSKIYSMPEAASAMQNIGLLPETERSALAERINSLPEEKRASFIRTFNSLPDAEIASSMERINAFSEEDFISMVRSFNSLSKDELNSLVDEFNAQSIPQNVAMDNGLKASPEMSIVSSGDGFEHFWGNSFKYHNMSLRLCLQ
ncbi:MAG: hypothetical protein LBI28_02775 [Treponema sp.]|jgi:phage-related tail protein|nr:hypothetical protein [Treponema sp.]